MLWGLRHDKLAELSAYASAPSSPRSSSAPAFAVPASAIKAPPLTPSVSSASDTSAGSGREPDRSLETALTHALYRLTYKGQAASLHHALLGMLAVRAGEFRCGSPHFTCLATEVRLLSYSVTDATMHMHAHTHVAPTPRRAGCGGGGKAASIPAAAFAKTVLVAQCKQSGRASKDDGDDEGFVDCEGDSDDDAGSAAAAAAAAGAKSNGAESFARMASTTIGKLLLRVLKQQAKDRWLGADVGAVLLTAAEWLSTAGE